MLTRSRSSVSAHDRHVADDPGRGRGQTEEIARTILTIAVTQEQSEKLIWADRFGELNFALLTEDSKIVDKDGT